MKITHFKQNFYTAVDYRYNYLIGFFRDVITIAKYRDGRKLAEFDIENGKHLVRVKNNCKFNVTLEPGFLFGTIEHWKTLVAENDFGKEDQINKDKVN